jgi:hypothetical protein
VKNMRVMVNAVVVALLLLPPAALAQTPRHRAGGPNPGMTRGDYVKSAQARAENLAGRRFDQIDSAHKGVISRNAYIKYYAARSAKLAARRFDQIDTDHNGVLESSEIAAWRAAHRRAPRQRRAGATAH